MHGRNFPARVISLLFIKRIYSSMVVEGGEPETIGLSRQEQKGQII
jgi:hypothetical protein